MKKLSIRQFKNLQHLQPVQTLQPQNSTPPRPIATQLTRITNIRGILLEQQRTLFKTVCFILHQNNPCPMSTAIACNKSSSDLTLSFLYLSIPIKPKMVDGLYSLYTQANLPVFIFMAPRPRLLCASVGLIGKVHCCQIKELRSKFAYIGGSQTKVQQTLCRYP